MTRRKGEGPGADGARRLSEGLARLRRGKFASAWVCREVLSLDAHPDFTEIADAVHKQLHHAKGLVRVGENQLAAMVAILAGSILMRRLLG